VVNFPETEVLAYLAALAQSESEAIVDAAAVWAAPSPALLRPPAPAPQEEIDADAHSMTLAPGRRTRGAASGVGAKRSAIIAGLLPRPYVLSKASASSLSPQVAPLHHLWEDLRAHDVFRTAAIRAAAAAAAAGHGAGSIRSVRLASIAASAAISTSMRSITSTTGGGAARGSKPVATGSGRPPAPSRTPTAASASTPTAAAADAGDRGGAGIALPLLVPPSPSLTARSAVSGASDGVREPPSDVDSVPGGEGGGTDADDSGGGGDAADAVFGSPLPRIPEGSPLDGDAAMDEDEPEGGQGEGQGEGESGDGSGDGDAAQGADA
jgi:hypothetical protein